MTMPTPAGPTHMAMSLLRTMEQMMESILTPPKTPMAMRIDRVAACVGRMEDSS